MLQRDRIVAEREPDTVAVLREHTLHDGMKVAARRALVVAELFELHGRVNAPFVVRGLLVGRRDALRRRGRRQRGLRWRGLRRTHEQKAAAKRDDQNDDDDDNGQKTFHILRTMSLRSDYELGS